VGPENTGITELYRNDFGLLRGKISYFSPWLTGIEEMTIGRFFTVGSENWGGKKSGNFPRPALLRGR
jgi:hypothetical protein